jgi:hypothetical protein
VHKDAHTYVGNFGGYGSGKTLVSREEIIKHALITPNANILIGAKIVPQYDQTIRRELEADLPAAWVADVSAQKSYIDLINGARIIYRPFYDPDVLRSLNLTMFVMVEASEISGEVFHQLKTRLRNMNASVQMIDEEGNPVFEFNDRGVLVPVIKAEWRRGIIESNPDSGWIRTDVLMNASDIQYHGNVTEQYNIPKDEQDDAISSHIATSDCNAYLPSNFYKENTKNKPAWWIARYMLGSFSYAEGLVYPHAVDHFVPDFEIPKDWKRIMAHDYGLSDDAVFLWGAIDPDHGMLYIYKEIRVNNRNVHELAQYFFSEANNVPYGGMYCQPIIDPKSGAKRDYNKDSLKDLYLQEGISFKLGYVNIAARILRTNTYFESGHLKIFESCTGLKAELKDYKFPPRTLEGKSSDKPIDKNNHAINPLEWICMELPSEPRQLTFGVYNKFGEDITQIVQAKENYIPYALRDDDDAEEYRFSPYQIQVM